MSEAQSLSRHTSAGRRGGGGGGDRTSVGPGKGREGSRSKPTPREGARALPTHPKLPGGPEFHPCRPRRSGTAEVRRRGESWRAGVRSQQGSSAGALHACVDCAQGLDVGRRQSAEKKHVQTPTLSASHSPPSIATTLRALKNLPLQGGIRSGCEWRSSLQGAGDASAAGSVCSMQAVHSSASLLPLPSQECPRLPSRLLSCSPDSRDDVLAQVVGRHGLVTMVSAICAVAWLRAEGKAAEAGAQYHGVVPAQVPADTKGSQAQMGARM